MRVLSRLLITSLVASPNLVYAEDTDVRPLEPMTVTTGAQRGLDLDTPSNAGSRLGLSNRENPASVAIADRETLDLIGARDLQDAANILPGFNLASFPGRGGFVSYRGFTGAQVNQLFNGIPLAYVIAARPVDSWIYDRVEAVGGPSSFLYGASSVGGSLNYVTKSAQRVDQEVTARLGIGSFDAKSAAIGVNKAVNETNWVRFDYSYTDSESHINRVERRADTLALSWLTDLSDRLSHTLAFEYQEEQVDNPYWGTPTLTPQLGTIRIDKGLRKKNFNVEDGIYQQRVRWLRSVTQYQFNDKTSLQNTLYHYGAKRDYRNLEGYRYTDASNTLVRRQSGLLQRHTQEMTGNRLELTHLGQLFNRQSDWALGLDFNVNRHTGYPTSSGVFDTVDPYNFTPGKFEDLGLGSLQRGRSNRVEMASVFAENRQGLTERLSLVSALRYDTIRSRFRTQRGGEAFRGDWNTLSGRLGVVFDLNSDVMFYAQYSTSSEPPGGTLTTSNNTSIDDFDISKGRQFEVGSKFNYLDGRGTATIAAYHITRRNFLTRDPNDNTVFVQVGQQSSLGLEIASTLQITDTIRADGNVAFVDAEYDKFFESGESRKGKTPSSVPKRVANLWLIYEPDVSWQFGTGLRHVASVYANNENTTWLPAYTLYDAFVSYNLNQHAALTLRGRNLSNKHYAYSGSGVQYYVGEPRSVDLTLDLKF